MSTPANGTAGWTADLRSRLDELVDEYRASLRDSLAGLTAEMRRGRAWCLEDHVVGLLKHVTYVEGVWFEQAIGAGRTW